MKQTTSLHRWLVALFVALCALSSHATTVTKMDMDMLVNNADRIFRGTVVSKEPGTVKAGGGTLSIVIYTLRVNEGIKGRFGGADTVELRMLGDLKATPTSSAAVRNLAHLDLNPDLEMGREYVLFTTQPSAIGLSTTVGLDQGLFKVYTDGAGRELVANGMNNLGLFDGPVSYADMSAAVRDAVSK